MTKAVDHHVERAHHVYHFEREEDPTLSLHVFLKESSDTINAYHLLFVILLDSLCRGAMIPFHNVGTSPLRIQLSFSHINELHKFYSHIFLFTLTLHQDNDEELPNMARWSASPLSSTHVRAVKTLILQRKLHCRLQTLARMGWFSHEKHFTSWK